MVENSSISIVGDRALADGGVDRLGFGEVAKRVARSIVDRASSDGFVVGIDGKWGSGKSSLLHLVERSLQQLPAENRPTIINFRPWLVGNRDALLTALFSDLADKIAEVRLSRGDATAITIQKAQKAAATMRRFAYAVSMTGDVVSAAGQFWEPVGWIGKLLKWSGDKLERKPDSDLSILKDNLTGELRDLDHRFIIAIDDVDRLEPGEIIEVLRLVRSVADFPNIIYILCYDADILADAIQRGADVTEGRAFLEKIVQLAVMTPTPEPFALRQWFGEALGDIVGEVPYEITERLKTVIDQEGVLQLRTPRSVVKTLDSIRFLWPALKDEHLDVADLVWLQLIKDGSPQLYRWIEDYSAEMSATSFGTTMVSDRGKERISEELIKCGGNSQFGDIMYRHFFSEQLPGISSSFADDAPPIKVHQEVDARARDAAIIGRRLASPDHYRLYFSLSGPSHAVSKAGFDAFWAAAEAGADEIAALLLNLHHQVALGSLRKSDVLLERLLAVGMEQASASRARHILFGFGLMMDEAYRVYATEEFFVVSTWDRAARLVPQLLRRIDPLERLDLVRNLFEQSASLGWLTAIYRDEIFAHGIHGNQSKPQEYWLLSAEEYTAASDTMNGRYRSLTIEELLATPRPIHIFYAWNQGGEPSEPREVVEAAISSDEGLVNVLEMMTGTIHSSNRGSYIALKRENLHHFIDYDSIRPRLKSIVEGTGDLTERARRLLQALHDGGSRG